MTPFRLSTSSAVENYERAEQLNPADPNLYNWRALFWERAGFFERALADYETCLELEPLYFSCGDNMHGLLITTGNYEAAAALNRSLLIAAQASK